MNTARHSVSVHAGASVPIARVKESCLEFVSSVSSPLVRQGAVFTFELVILLHACLYQCMTQQLGDENEYRDAEHTISRASLTFAGSNGGFQRQ
jgi:hypothetical protein